MISPATDEKRVRTLSAPVSEILGRMTTEELRAHLVTLQALSESLLVHLRMAELIGDLLHRLRTHLLVDTASVALSSNDGGPLVTRASEGFPEEDETGGRSADVIRLGEGIAGAVALRGEPVIIDEVGAVEGMRPRLRCHSSMMIAPLMVDGELLGLVEVGTFEPRHFTDPDLYLLHVIAQRGAAAMRNARLLDDTESRLRDANQVEAALAESEARYRILADTAVDAIMTIDRRSVIRSANPAAAVTFGYEVDELIGRSFGDLIPERLRERHFQGVERYLATGVKRLPWKGMVLPGLHRDGREIELDVAFAEHVIDGEPLFTGTMRDITDRRRTERILAAQHATTRVLAHVSSIEEAIPKILRGIGDSIQWEAGGYWSWADAEQALRPLDFWTALSIRGEAFVDASRGTVLSPGEGLPGRVWSSRKPHWIRDVAEDRDFPRLAGAARAGLRSGFAFPICVGDDCIGVMEFLTTRYTDADSAMLQAMDALGSDIGQFIRRREAESRVEEQESEQRFLAGVTTALSAASIDYEETLNSLPGLAVPRLGDWASVHVRRPDGSIDRLGVAHTDPEMETIARELERFGEDEDPERPLHWVIRTGEPLLIPTVTAEHYEAAGIEGRERRILQELGMVSVMMVPLVARDRILGSLGLVSIRPDRQFGRKDLALAMKFAQRAGIAIDNARLYREMLEANRAKAEFLATVSHELRTPLNAVIGYADLLGMGVGDEDPNRANEYAARIGIAARHLSQLIEEVLAFSRLESGREVVTLGPVRIRDLLEEIRVIAEPLAEENGLDLIVGMGDEDVEMVSDARKVRQILLNVVGNAIKFTREGEVEIDWTRQGEQIVLRVRDTGPGIPKEHQERIFEPFWQVEQGTTRSVGGTGLGLTVTRRFVDLLGGQLTLESDPGSGTTVLIRLPIDGPPDAEDSAPGAEIG